ncbi:hypothetical protein DSL64_03515 [Dyadobacter luteus]|uniref:Uncharacterized protein n=1 Tax=Dyadobacter luteus TaxID=2259619 RepID=A0A3D8YFS4_9BACT|nr:hypothetical protein [Dyadobacter luteus]REA63525.1 hypothetical protein DSL64_03515 [Dyadobacter luteus]
MDAFFNIGIKRETDEALIQSLIEYDQIKLNQAEFIPVEPFEMEITEGNKLYDVVGFQDTSNFAISERFYSLLKEHLISGWKGYQISISGISEKYYGLQVTGRCGKLEQPKEAGFYKGYKFDYATWDKSNLFSPDETVLLFCTKKVRDLLKKNKITNLDVTDISKIHAYSVGVR